MAKEEELSREEAKWMRKQQELFNRLKALEPKAAKVEYGEETKAWSVSEERLAEYDKVKTELEEAEAKLREIREKLKKLKN